MTRIFIISIVLFYSCSKKTTVPVQEITGDIQVQYLQEGQIQLAAPVIKVDSFLFKESAKIEMSFDVDDAQIFYAIGDDEVKEYNKPIIIDKSCTLQAEVRKKAFIDSRTTFLQFKKVSINLSDSDISVSPTASDSYPGSGATSLIDLEKGTLNFRNGNQWLGFQSKIVDIDLRFPNAHAFDQVCLSMLSDEKSWIFRPDKIYLVLDGDTLSRLIVPKTQKNELANSSFWCVPVDQEKKCSKLKVVVESLNAIPDWHDGKGTPPWLFVDEIIVK